VQRAEDANKTLIDLWREYAASAAIPCVYGVFRSDPINAMLNLAYAKEAGRLGAMLAASGTALAIGFLHCDTPHRHSLVFEALAPLRPLIDAKVSRLYRAQHIMDRGDFLRFIIAAAYGLEVIHSNWCPAPRPPGESSAM
jgi:hypothetical protein